MKNKSLKLKKSLNPKKSSKPIVTKGVTQGVAKEKKQLVKSDGSNPKDIISLILRDHEPIKKLILVLKDSEASMSKKRPAYSEFKKLLSVHAKAEQDSLYVRMKTEDVLRVEALEGDMEHSLSAQLLSEIQMLEKDSDKDAWMAKVKVLAELVDHHIKEEESDVFKLLHKQFSADVLTEIGKDYLQKFNPVQSNDFRKRIPMVQNDSTEHTL